MLRRLSVRDIVLIDRLDLEFHEGLAALTGETGAGKSILLDSLGLVLGARSDATLVRPSADKASVAARFDRPAAEILALLDQAGIDIGGDDLLVRRQLSKDGRSRAFVNDQPVTIGLLRNIGERLVEVHGQYERYGMLNPNAHRAILDTYGAYSPLLNDVQSAHESWQKAVAAETSASEELARARNEREELERQVGELDSLAPQVGEEASLAGRRELLQQAEKLATALDNADALLAGESGASSSLHRALRELNALAGIAAERTTPALSAIERACVEVDEALHILRAMVADLEADPNELEHVEERLFALRAQARIHGCGVEDLPQLHQSMRQRVNELENEGEQLAKLAQVAEQARRQYVAAAEAMSKTRKETAKRLETAISKELPPLRLAKAQLVVRVDRLAPSEWSARGMDRVIFDATMNPGVPPGPIHRIASGGELGRFLLALKVVLAVAVQTPTLVFDEVDAGVSGATAAAIGDRLARLAQDRQILAVTHSPQVAARAQQHLRVKKRAAAKTPITEVDVLPTVARREEIARMLSGARITEEARAAADQLMARHIA